MHCSCVSTDNPVEVTDQPFTNQSTSCCTCIPLHLHAATVAFHSSTTYDATRRCRYDVPLVADIHFQPAVAMMVAEAFEKIRINPGNFADGRKTFEEINYDDPKEFEAERVRAGSLAALGGALWCFFLFGDFWRKRQA